MAMTAAPPERKGETLKCAPAAGRSGVITRGESRLWSQRLLCGACQGERAEAGRAGDQH